MLVSPLTHAGEYASCSSNKYSGGTVYFASNCVNKDNTFCAAIDNNSRAGIHGSVAISGEKGEKNRNVTFKSRDFWGDVYSNVEFTMPLDAFRCETKYE